MSPSSREAMDRFKMLIRSANLWGSYNASLTSCKPGRIIMFSIYQPKPIYKASNNTVACPQKLFPVMQIRQT